MINILIISVIDNNIHYNFIFEIFQVFRFKVSLFILTDFQTRMMQEL